MKAFQKHRICLYRKKARLCVFALVAMPLFTASAQDAVFSQFYASSLYLNPALAGLQPDINVGINHRVQWTALAPYTTSQLSVIYPFINKKNPVHEHWGGTGLTMHHDKAGVDKLDTKSISANLSYNVVLGAHQVIAFGLQGGAMQQSIDQQSFDWGSKYTSGVNFDQSLVDKSNNGNFQSKIIPEVSAGGIWYLNPTRDFIYKKYTAFLGFSCYHLNQAKYSFLNLQSERHHRIYKLHGGIEYQLSSRINLLPNFIYARQNSNSQLNLGCNLSLQISKIDTGLLSHTELLLGGWYRLKDATILFAGIHSKVATMGFSYDLNTAAFKDFAATNHTYELSLSLRIPKSLKHMRYYSPRI